MENSYVFDFPQWFIFTFELKQGKTVILEARWAKCQLVNVIEPALRRVFSNKILPRTPTESTRFRVTLRRSTIWFYIIIFCKNISYDTFTKYLV